MNIKDLSYYVALTEQKNFSAVAAQFNVSQPTISAAIKRLEAELRTKLLLRGNPHQPIQITATGNQVLVHARQILAEAQLMRIEVAHIDHDQLSIGMPPIIEIAYFPQVARQLPTSIFNQIEPVSQGSLAVLTNLKNGQLDLALLGYLDELDEPDITVERFDQQPFTIVVARNHPLAQQPRLAFKQLQHYPFVALKHHFVHRQAFQRLARQNHIQPPIIFESNEIQSVLNMVANQVGIALMSQAVPIDDRQLVRIPLTDTTVPQFNVGLAYRRSTQFSPVQSQLVNQIRQAFKNQ
ncbi:LysR family transcriptional regulator [Lactiplantibacillus fabifermentans]|uniref:Transcription regulator n=2 Tax=Lactiplantibacillus fabifermentans TaxID=483011 RepID=A0A0R2NXF2_9LACO|nr:LysR family transcriptional regulator [Lactiplantibacillus fabifermentans]ETY75560.1 LysR family transcriptional regulator [Lactiplantibacillus fabifermentans T30PCM01]KRO28864.1 transcription regulator [Lactiplantibacillus fabifermentans DSM 21115]